MSDKLFIIGAPRSGTNALRDLITSLPDFYTWPCDEINFLWRHHHFFNKTDILLSSDASLSNVQFMSQQFKHLSKNEARTIRNSDSRVKQIAVEKTCANCLRLSYINKLFPNSYYIYIRRDPYDVVASAVKRWSHAGVDFLYLYQKARFIPISDLFPYSIAFLFNKLYSSFSGSQSLMSWGPRVPCIDFVREYFSIEFLCAFQWRYCTRSATHFFERFDSSSYFEMSYEDFVSDPVSILSSALDSLQVDYPLDYLHSSAHVIHARSVGLGSQLSSTQRNDIFNGITFCDQIISSMNPISRISND